MDLHLQLRNNGLTFPFVTKIYSQAHIAVHPRHLCTQINMQLIYLLEICSESKE